MRYVNVFIEGLSTSYYKNNNNDVIWNVIFPCDGKHHRVNFDYIRKNGSTIPEPISLEFKDIHIKAEKFIKPKSHQHANFDKVLDLTSDDLHKEGLKLAGSPAIGRSVMIVENAFFYTAELRKRLNFVYKKPDTSPWKSISDELASLIGVEIELEESGRVIMEVGGMPDLIFEEGDSLYFDNYCSVCRNDFQLYQDIFENSSDNTIEFEMVSNPLPPRPIVEPTVSKLLAGPPPAFCDGTRISITDDL